MQQITLHERVDNWADNLTVDHEQRIVCNVALAGTLSRNGYRYSEEALEAAVSLYENRPVFLDHAAARSGPLDRSTRDLVGTVVNARYFQSRIRGDIRVLDTEAGQTFLKLVESETPGVGMSHVVMAQRGADGKVVDKILNVLSVDAVINPATTDTFRESADGLCTGGTACESCTRKLVQLDQERVRLEEQKRELARQLTQLQDREQVERLLQEFALPADAVTDCFREQLRQSSSDATRRALIADRQRLLSEARRGSRPLSFDRPGGQEPQQVTADFLRVLRRTAR